MASTWKKDVLLVLLIIALSIGTMIFVGEDSGAGTSPAPPPTTSTILHAPYYATWCGVPTGTIYHLSATLDSKSNDALHLIVESGDILTWESEDASSYTDDTLYLLMLDDMGTISIIDDTIIKVYKEIY